MYLLTFKPERPKCFEDVQSLIKKITSQLELKFEEYQKNGKFSEKIFEKT